MVGLDGFVKSLPAILSQKVTIKMHKKSLGNSDLFRVIKNKRLLAHIGNRLRPQMHSPDTTIYRKGDEIQTFIVITSGIAAFIEPKKNNAIFAVVDPNGFYEK
jgi:hypothetical protein